MAWFYDGFTPSEIAKELNMAAPAVRQTLQRAREHVLHVVWALPDGFDLAYVSQNCRASLGLGAAWFEQTFATG